MQCKFDKSCTVRVVEPATGKIFESLRIHASFIDFGAHFTNNMAINFACCTPPLPSKTLFPPSKPVRWIENENPPSLIERSEPIMCGDGIRQGSGAQPPAGSSRMNSKAFEGPKRMKLVDHKIIFSPCFTSFFTLK